MPAENLGRTALMPGMDTDVLIIGAGQAGLGLSYYLKQAGVDHLVIDKGRLGNAWRTQRWDTFCLVTPNWSIQLPGAAYRGDDPDGFMGRDDFVSYLENWANAFGAPFREGVEAFRVERSSDHFVVETTDGIYHAHAVAVATATHQRPRRPRNIGALPGSIKQFHATEYRNPDTLPEGPVMVVGSGQTGAQMAQELREAGRDTYLCVGRTGRLIRRYRGRDCIAWQNDMGLLDRTPDMLEDPALRFRGDPHVSGKNGGHTLSLHDFHHDGITLLGRLARVEGGHAYFDDTVRDDMAAADAAADAFMASIDTFIDLSGQPAPAPTPEELSGGPPKDDWDVPVIRDLDLVEAAIGTVIWATGFAFDFSWIDAPVFDEFGYPITNRGATSVPGLYFTGLNWMHKRKSGILFGVNEDAAYLARLILGER
ncbi:NAD(P)-binding domain-containing protein [Alphaproteobacteria bacterium]|nr:NAD(P)-binding domain-containing protein [Alphaproteobacteria bacterium]